MTTAQDIIQDALEKLGVYAAGETMSDADAERGLTVLNDMLDSWSNESLSCYAVVQQSGALQAGVQQYTIGVGGAFNLTRPLRLIDVPGSAFVVDANGNKYPISVVPIDTWSLLANTTSTVTSTYPDTLFYDPQYPLGVLNFFPYPNLSATAYWSSYLQLVDFASLTAAINLPPGYSKAFKDNLAIELKPYFRDGELDPVIVQAASKSKGNIKRTNLRPIVARYDGELASRTGLSPNIYTGGYS